MTERKSEEVPFFKRGRPKEGKRAEEVQWRRRERERDLNSENSAFCSKSSPPYVPRVLYRKNRERGLKGHQWMVHINFGDCSFLGSTEPFCNVANVL